MSTRTERLAQKNYWNALFELRDRQRAERGSGVQVIKESELPVEINRQGIMRWYMHPEITDTVLSTYLCFQQEIPPGAARDASSFRADRSFTSSKAADTRCSTA